jgi:hypothetical protein
MIIFLGDSFTWGQGLYSKKWIQSGNSIEYCNNHLPPTFSHGNISHSDDEYRRKYHFPNLVANHFDRSYYSKPKNGGTNKDISKMATYIFDYAENDAVELVVIQFTEFLRNFHYKIPDEYKNEGIEDWINLECSKQIESIYKTLIGYGIKNILMFSWRGDIGRLLKSQYSENYVPLYYNDNQYMCFGDMLSENSELELAGELGINDGHFSELGHRVIADSIIKKIDTMNIKFIRPREKTLV